MKIKGLDVSGITFVVINRKYVWERDAVWILRNPLQRAKSTTDMIKYINSLISNKRNRIWVHGNTLNIVEEL